MTYAHDSERHKQDVLPLASLLRANGIETFKTSLGETGNQPDAIPDPLKA
jgi:hypothetical protein